MNSRANPFISVVMPVYNALPFLDDSINSILTQTLSDFEFVIFDDASDDDSIGRLREWAARDQRIRLYESKQQLGLSGSSNAVVAQTRASIVARMDADDIAHPERLERQWDVIQNSPDVIAVGTLCNGIDASGRRTIQRKMSAALRRLGFEQLSKLHSLEYGYYHWHYRPARSKSRTRLIAALKRDGFSFWRERVVTPEGQVTEEPKWIVRPL